MRTNLQFDRSTAVKGVDQPAHTSTAGEGPTIFDRPPGLQVVASPTPRAALQPATPPVSLTVRPTPAPVSARPQTATAASWSEESGRSTPSVGNSIYTAPVGSPATTASKANWTGALQQRTVFQASAATTTTMPPQQEPQFQALPPTGVQALPPPTPFQALPPTQSR
jgi:hypothetical protein